MLLYFRPNDFLIKELNCKFKKVSFFNLGKWLSLDNLQCHILKKKGAFVYKLKCEMGPRHKITPRSINVDRLFGLMLLNGIAYRPKK